MWSSAMAVVSPDESARPAGHSSAGPGMRRPSLEFLPNDSAQLAGLRGGEVALLRFRVRVQHVERLLASRPVVDDPQPASLAATGLRPAHLPEAARAGNYGALLRPQDQGDLELTIRLVVEMPSERSREYGRLNEPHRMP